MGPLVKFRKQERGELKVRDVIGQGDIIISN